MCDGSDELVGATEELLDAEQAYRTAPHDSEQIGRMVRARCRATSAIDAVKSAR